MYKLYGVGRLQHMVKICIKTERVMTILGYVYSDMHYGRMLSLVCNFSDHCNSSPFQPPAFDHLQQPTQSCWVGLGRGLQWATPTDTVKSYHLHVYPIPYYEQFRVCYFEWITGQTVDVLRSHKTGCWQTGMTLLLTFQAPPSDRKLSPQFQHRGSFLHHRVHI